MIKRISGDFSKGIKNDKANLSLINLIYMIIFYLMFIILLFLLNFLGLTNLEMYLGIVATILGLLSISLTIYFYKETNNLYIDMKDIIDEIKTYTKHIFTKESERVDKFIEKATETVPLEKINRGAYVG
ncbi:MAG: hypothetical protein KJ949_01060 [Nanoarchaeota archaeon]|nr:hypothetical protein [Nanoarchaeota archaeon]